MRFCYKNTLLVLLLLLATTNRLWAQSNKDNDSLIQFSGIVLSSDSLLGLENVHIRVKGKYFGTASNTQGIFTLVTRPGDTVLFSCIGYKRNEYVVPNTLKSKLYSMIITLTADTFTVSTVIVTPFISSALLPYYFATLNLPEDEMDVLAKRNLESELLRQQAAALGADGAENQDYIIRQEAAKYYYAGQAPPINILNPFAWAQFIKAWKNGDFKKKK